MDEWVRVESFKTLGQVRSDGIFNPVRSDHLSIMQSQPVDAHSTAGCLSDDDELPD